MFRELAPFWHPCGLIVASGVSGATGGNLQLAPPPCRPFLAGAPSGSNVAHVSRKVFTVRSSKHPRTDRAMP